MPQAAILEELLQLVNSSDGAEKISPEQVNKLVLACVIEIYQKQKDLQEIVEPMIAQMKFIRWLGAGLGFLILVLVWEIITHEVIISYP